MATHAWYSGMFWATIDVQRLASSCEVTVSSPCSPTVQNAEASSCIHVQQTHLTTQKRLKLDSENFENMFLV